MVDGSIGAAIGAAVARAEQLAKASPRAMRVRISTDHADYRDGLTIYAHIAARTGAELDVQQGFGVRRAPWAELDARAGELVGLVDAVVVEVAASIATAAGHA